MHTRTHIIHYFRQR